MLEVELWLSGGAFALLVLIYSISVVKKLGSRKTSVCGASTNGLSNADLDRPMARFSVR